MKPVRYFKVHVLKRDLNELRWFQIDLDVIHS